MPFLSKHNPELLLKIRYFLTFKKKLNLKNPQDLNEKILWAKLHTIFQLTKRAGVAFRGAKQSPQIRILYTKSARKLAENCPNIGFR